MSGPEPWISVPEAADYAKHHAKTILRALRRGELQGVQRQVNGSWRTRATYVDTWLAGDGGPKKKGRAGATAAALTPTKSLGSNR